MLRNSERASSKRALEVMDWMVKMRETDGFLVEHAIHLNLLSKVKGIKSAEDYFFNLPVPAKNQRTYVALLNCYFSAKMAVEAIALYQKMKELNLATSTKIHNNLMALYMKLDQPEKVPTQLQEMKANNIAPDNLTYCILMKSYASLNDIESVERVIHEMEEGEEVTLHWTAYSTLAAIYNSAGLFKKAESALKKLEKLIDSHDPEPFLFLISLYADVGNLDEVNRVWKSLKATFQVNREWKLAATFEKQNNMSYLTMLQALNKLDDIDGLKQCYEEWESVYLVCDLKLTNLAIGAYLRKDMVEEAESCCRKVSDMIGGFNLRTCDLFIEYYSKNQDMRSALRWLEVATQMVKEGEWKLDGEKVKAFLKYYEKAKDVEGAEKFCKILKKLDCLGMKEYELFRTYAAAGRREPLLHKWIKEDRIELNP